MLIAAVLALAAAQREGGDAARHAGGGRHVIERLQNATAVLRQFVADRKIAGAVAAVARHGKIVYLEPVGLQSLETRDADDGAIAVPRSTR